MAKRCWWDGHTFENTPVFLPVKYDEKRDSFLAVGTFCSFPCVKAYNLDGRSGSSGLNSTLITLLHKRMCGCIRRIPCAPHFSALEAYGGTMTIEEFRNGTDKVLTGPLPTFSYRHDEFKVQKNTSDRALQCIREADVHNQPLKLMRKTPLYPRGEEKDGGNLLKRMGIVMK